MINGELTNGFILIHRWRIAISFSFFNSVRMRISRLPIAENVQESDTTMLP
ncbi:MAG: hypothetical protein JWP81_5327 [Ferruginibacter sp.]|nr:hypothetical protein [Ferruginibacter sp.]